MSAAQTSLATDLPQPRRKRPSFNAEKLLLSACILVPLLGLLLFFVLPLLTVVWNSFVLLDGSYGLGNYLNVLHSVGIGQAIKNSVVLGVSATVVSVGIAFVFAYTLERTPLRGKKIFQVILILPLLAPSLVQAIGLLFLFGRNGLLAMLTGWDLNIYGFWGLLISDVFWILPQAVMILQAALRNADARYYDAAEVMGASKWRQFIDITLPNAKFGLLSASFVAFVLTITDFGNAFVIGGRYNVLAIEIYNRVVGQMDFGMGSVVGILLLLPALAAVYIERVSSQKQFGTASEDMVPVVAARSPVRDWILGAVCWLTAAFIVLVVAMVVYASFVKLWPYDLSFTLKNYFLDTSGSYMSLLTSLKISIAAAVGGTLILFMLAFGVQHKTGLLARSAYLLAMVPVGVPGLVIGLAYIFAFNEPASPLYLLYGSVALIALCNFYHYHTQGFLTMITGMRAVPSALEDAVSCLGGGTRNVLRDAIMPFMSSTLLSVFFYLFMRSMVTLSAVIFLITATLSVASVKVMTLDHDGFVTQAAAFSTVIMLIVGASMLLMRLFLSRATRRLDVAGET